MARPPTAASGLGLRRAAVPGGAFVTEMQYQHLVFEEFARKLVPSINEFIGDGINFQSDTNPAIFAEFAHQTYRLGHSMLTETISRVAHKRDAAYDISLLDGFLNPLEFSSGAGGQALTAAQAAGAIFQGGTQQVGNEIDEFVTEAVRNNLLGLPLDLAVLNLARGRERGHRAAERSAPAVVPARPATPRWRRTMTGSTSRSASSIRSRWSTSSPHTASTRR